MSYPQTTWYPFDYRPIMKVSARSLVSNILGMYVFVVLGMMGQIWAVTTAEEHSMIIKPFVWGLAYACGMFVSGGYSGGSFHPGVTLAHALSSKHSITFIRAMYTLLCDFLAAGMAAVTVAFLTIYEVEAYYGKDFKSNGGARELYLHEINSDSYFLEVIADSVFSSFLYALILAGLTDTKNLGMDRCWKPLYTCIDVIVVGLAFGYVHGSTFNPYIDLVPRIACSCVGFGHCWKPWYQVLLTIVLSTVFAFFGVLTYSMLLEDRIKQRDHLVPHYGGRRPPKRANLTGPLSKPEDENIPHLVRRRRENFEYLLDAENETTNIQNVPVSNKQRQNVRA